MAKSTEDLYIAYCILLIEDKLKWGKSNNWRNRNFVALSELISSKTKYQISVTTLKRLWGKISYEGSVGPTTLDALAVFLGYKNWMDFKSTNFDNITSGQMQDKLAPLVRKKGKDKLIYMAAGLGIIVIVIFAGIYLGSKPKNTKLNREKIGLYTFEAINPKGTVPYTVKISFNISAIDYDSIFIQAGDQERKHLVTKKDRILNRIYFIPGAKKAYLWVNNVIIDSLLLFAYTDEWTSIIRVKENTHPFYMPYDSLMFGNRLYLHPKKLQSLHIDMNKPFFINYYNIKHYNIDGDNFAFKVRVKNSIKEGADVCQKTNVGIITSNGFIVVPLINPGCVALAKLYVGNIYINGWTNDLSNFAMDMNNWHEVYYKVINEKVKIFVDNILAWEGTYTKNMGEVLGFRIEFQGCGSIDYVQLFDESNQIVYNEDFGALSK